MTWKLVANPNSYVYLINGTLAILICKYISGLSWIYDSLYLIGCIVAFSLYCAVNFKRK